MPLTMLWHHPTEKPRNKQVILIVYQDQLAIDTMVYDEQQDVLFATTGTYEWGEVQAWAAWSDIPKPDWLREQMKKQIAEGHKTIAISAEYRKDKADLFGEVADPDDVADGR